MSPLRAGISLTVALCLCMSGTAAALMFGPAPGSPYLTTDQPYVPTGGGILGEGTAGDFNGDGIADVAVDNATGVPAFRSGESVTVLLGHRQGGLTIAPGSPVELYSGGMFASHGAIASGDFNRDGKLDLAVVDNIHNTVSIMLGEGNGRFQPTGHPISFLSWEPRGIAVGDFTGNEVPDLAFASGGRVNVFLGDGSGGFAPAPGSPFEVSGDATAVAAARLNSDNRSDLAVTTSGQLTVFLATGEGRFQEAPGSPTPTGEGSKSITAADLTGDGRTDLAIANEAGNVTVLLGDGAGGYSPAGGSPFTVPSGAPPEYLGLPDSIAAGDFTGDGNVDLAVANFNGSSNNIAVLAGDGRGVFTNIAGSPFPAHGNPGPVLAGDFNGDGHLDLAAVNPFQGVVTVLQNASEGNPEEPAPSSGGSVKEDPTKIHTPTEIQPSRTQIVALMAQQLGLANHWARRRLTGKRGSFTFGFKALEAGMAVLEWYAAPGSHRQTPRAAKPVLIATGRLWFPAAGNEVMRVSLTKAGRLLWRRGGRLRVIEKGSFTAAGIAPVVVTRAVAFGKGSH